MLKRILGAGLGAALALALAQPAAAQDKKALSVGIVSDPVTLDPAQMASFFELSVQYNIHEPILHMTPDLKQQQATLAALEGARHLLRRQLAERLTIFRIPELHFEADITQSTTSRMEHLLKRVRKGRPRE